jgi:hypothetical protein
MLKVDLSEFVVESGSLNCLKLSQLREDCLDMYTLWQQQTTADNSRQQQATVGNSPVATGGGDE